MIAIRRFALTATVACLACSTPAMSDPSSAKAEQASAFLLTTHRFIAAIQLDAESSLDEKRALIERLLNERLDLATMSRLALGKREKAFSRSQLSEFIQEYSRFLNYTYLREIAWSDPTELPTLGQETVDPRTGWVMITTSGRNRPSAVNQRGQFRQSSSFNGEYWLRERHGTWRITRIRFNGVDLNASFGSQFEAMLRQSEPEEVLTKLHELNNERDKKNPLQ